MQRALEVLFGSAFLGLAFYMAIQHGAAEHEHTLAEMAIWFVLPLGLGAFLVFPMKTQEIWRSVTSSVPVLHNHESDA